MYNTTLDSKLVELSNYIVDNTKTHMYHCSNYWLTKLMCGVIGCDASHGQFDARPYTHCKEVPLKRFLPHGSISQQIFNHSSSIILFAKRHKFIIHHTITVSERRENTAYAQVILWVTVTSEDVTPWTSKTSRNRISIPDCIRWYIILFLSQCRHQEHEYYVLMSAPCFRSQNCCNYNEHGIHNVWCAKVDELPHP